MAKLTGDIALRLAVGWRELISDDKLAAIVGITEKQLKSWLARNTKVTIVRSYLVDGQKQRRTETIGLRDLRAKEMERMEYDYLAMHSRLIQEAENKKDVKTALMGIQWRLERAIPDKYGKDGSVKKIDMLNLPEFE